MNVNASLCATFGLVYDVSDVCKLFLDHGKDDSPLTVHSSGDPYPLEVMKTFLSFLYMMFGKFRFL